MELGPKRWNWGQNDGIDLAKPMESGQKIGHFPDHTNEIWELNHGSVRRSLLSVKQTI